MYCETCDADVAAEVSTDGKSLLCTTCGGEVRKSFAPSLSDEAKSARDLLERWSQEDGTDPFGPIADGSSQKRDLSDEQTEHTPRKKPSFRVDSGDPPTDGEPPQNRRPAAPPTPPDESKKRRTDAAASLSGPKIRPKRRSRPNPPRDYEASGDLLERPNRPRAERPSESVARSEMNISDHDEPSEPVRPAASTPRSSNKKFRIDAAHTRAVELEGDGPTIPPPHRRPAPPMPDGHRLDAAQGIPAPHMRTESFIPPGGKRPGRVESMAGQLLAYGGVGLLTVGTALILSGYFGGPVKYAPTGWLVATIGQMFLFLGVVTLISGGMQQTTHEVGARVADLGSRLGRIEETTEMALHGPHYMRSRNQSAARVAVESEHPPERWIDDTDHPA